MHLFCPQTQGIVCPFIDVQDILKVVFHLTGCYSLSLNLPHNINYYLLLEKRCQGRLGLVHNGNQSIGYTGDWKRQNRRRFISAEFTEALRNNLLNMYKFHVSQFMVLFWNHFSHVQSMCRKSFCAGSFALDFLFYMYIKYTCSYWFWKITQSSQPPRDQTSNFKFPSRDKTKCHNHFINPFSISTSNNWTVFDTQWTEAGQTGETGNRAMVLELISLRNIATGHGIVPTLLHETAEQSVTEVVWI